MEMVSNTQCSMPLISVFKKKQLVANTINSGSNFVQGALNWGPTTYLNGVLKSYSWWSEKHQSFTSGFHMYILEWTQDFL